MLVSSDQEEVLFWLAMWFPVETHVTKFNMHAGIRYAVAPVQRRACASGSYDTISQLWLEDDKI